MSIHCEFALLRETDEAQTLFCVQCGRQVTVKSAASRRIIAHCRGVNETRWKQPPDVGQVRCLAGTALKSLLASIGITSTPNCSCNARAREMDTRGCDWCEENIDTIVGWLREEATNRNLPFLDAAGRLLVRRAIHNARKAAQGDKMK